MICPKNSKHQSTDSEYCSVCGAKLRHFADLGNQDASNPASALAHAPLPGGTQVCPDCGIERTNLQVSHCEVCQYTFEPTAHRTQTSTFPGTPRDDAPFDNDRGESRGRQPLGTVSSTINAPNSQKWEVLVTVDPSLYLESDPKVPCPVDTPESLFPLDLAETLIGRRSESKQIFPDVPVSDPGISHRHCKLLKEDDYVFLLDMGSKNGTYLNAARAHPGVKTLLKDGDQITLGCWTRITVRYAR